MIFTILPTVHSNRKGLTTLETMSLSRLVESIEQGKEREIVIARNGRPVAKLVPIDITSANNRIGIAKGLFEVPDNIDTYNDEVAQLFVGEAPS